MLFDFLSQALDSDDDISDLSQPLGMDSKHRSKRRSVSDNSDSDTEISSSRVFQVKPKLTQKKPKATSKPKMASRDIVQLSGSENSESGQTSKTSASETSFQFTKPTKRPSVQTLEKNSSKSSNTKAEPMDRRLESFDAKLERKLSSKTSSETVVSEGKSKTSFGSDSSRSRIERKPSHEVSTSVHRPFSTSLNLKERETSPKKSRNNGSKNSGSRVKNGKKSRKDLSSSSESLTSASTLSKVSMCLSISKRVFPTAFHAIG